MRRIVLSQRGRVRTLLTAAVLAVGVLVAGCGAGPSQVGAAAIVGQHRISIDTVQQQLRAVLDREGHRAKQALAGDERLDDVSRNIVTLSVREALLAAAARRENLAVGAQEVTRFVEKLGGARAASAGTIFTAEGFRQRARNLLLAAELGSKVLPGLAITVDYITERTREAAMKRARQLAAAGPSRVRKIIKNQIDQGAAAALDQKIVASENPELAAAPAFGVPEGTVVAFPSDRRLGAWLVMVVTQRSTTASAGGGADLHDLEPTVLRAVGIRQLALMGMNRGVRINPRYGVWDPVAVGVAPSQNDVTGFVAPLTGARAA